MRAGRARGWGGGAGGGGGITERRIKENAILYGTDYIWEHSTVSRASHPPYDIASYFIDFLLFSAAADADDNDEEHDDSGEEKEEDALLNVLCPSQSSLMPQPTETPRSTLSSSVWSHVETLHGWTHVGHVHKALAALAGLCVQLHHLVRNHQLEPVGIHAIEVVPAGPQHGHCESVIRNEAEGSP